MKSKFSILHKTLLRKLKDNYRLGENIFDTYIGLKLHTAYIKNSSNSVIIMSDNFLK